MASGNINAAAHPNLRSVDLYDLVENAKAAPLPRGGTDTWTTTHGGGPREVLAHRMDAEGGTAR